MKKIDLIIDTSDNKNVSAKLDIDGKEFISKSKLNNRNPDSIVNLIEDVLRQGKIDLQDIEQISVNEGPGSYTGLKVGASVSNALSFALGKKVNGRNLGEIIEPTY